MLSWQVEKSSPQISPDLTHRRFQISIRIPNQISPKISQTYFRRLGSPNVMVILHKFFGEGIDTHCVARRSKLTTRSCCNGSHRLVSLELLGDGPNIRDAEMTIKTVFERWSQKGGRQGVRKEGQQGTHLEILLSAQSAGKTAFWKTAFLMSWLLPRKYSDNNFGQLPPLQPSKGSD